MATQLQIRRGTTSQMNAFTGAEGELAVNTTTDTVHVHDGSTAGGHALAKADGSNIATYAGSFTTIAASGTITGNVTGNLVGNVTGNVTAASGTSSFTDVTINGTLNMNAGTTSTITNLTAPSNDLDAATKKYVDDEVAGLVDSAPGTLDTLNELAAALGDDADFSNTVTTSIATKLPLAGGTMTGAIAMGNQNITGINNLVINDPGPTEGISWNGGNTKIVESPDDLTTNSAGNLQFVFDDTRRMSITNTGADINGNLSLSGDLTASGNQVITAATQADVKFSVWSGTTYGIGMVSAVTLGYLNDYATTFVMNNDADRGWWWGYKDQTKSTGAMSLTTDGRLYVKSSIQAAILSGTGNRMVIANANGELSTQAIPSGGGGGGSSDISMDGSTANGLITYGGTDNIDVETNLTFDGTNLVTSSAVGL